MSTSLMKTIPASVFQAEYFPKVQPRSSAERENSMLLRTALKAASNDMAHRLLDYASLDKVDCEASCILIALANHDPNRPVLVDSRPKKELQEEEEKEEEEYNKQQEQEQQEQKTQQVQQQQQVQKQQQQQQQQQQQVQQQTIKEKTTEMNENKDVTQQTHPKNDPIMLLMAAAEVVNNDDEGFLNRQHQDGGAYEKRKKFYNYPSRDIRLLPNKRSMDENERKAYPNGRYYRKAEDQNKRVRTSPPTPAPTHQPDTWRRKSGHKSDHRSTKEDNNNMKSNTFSRQYHSMKQNPKVKQNALHAYITYMIYNDLAHGRKQSFDSRPDDTKFGNPMSLQDNQFSPSSFNHPHYAGGSPGVVNGNNSMMNGNGIGSGSGGPPVSIQRRSTDTVSLPQLTPSSTSTALSQTEPSIAADNHTNSSSNSSHASSMSPWYNSRLHHPPSAPPPPPPLSQQQQQPPPPSIPIHDDRSILSRPLTAFLWKDTSSMSSANSTSERKEMMILPPLSSRPSPNPSISTYDRLAPV